MKIIISISKKQSYGHSELKLKIKVRQNDKFIWLCANSNIFVRPEDWNEEAQSIMRYETKRIITEEIKEARQQADNLAKLLSHVNAAWEAADKNTITKKWMADVVDRYNFPEKYAPKDEQKEIKDIYGYFNDYLTDKKFSIDFEKGNMVMLRSVARYEMFVRATDNKEFVFDINTIDKDTIEDYRDYIANEKQLSEEHPILFKQIFANYPANVKRGNKMIEDRGSNAVFKLMKKLKAFFSWLNKKGITSNMPFVGVELGKEQFGEPYYITLDERNIIASTPMPTKHLETQRDIFVFHCFVGCRVSDLVKLSAANVTDGILTYTPHKTKDEGQQALQARVPLHVVAQELIKKYVGIDSKGRLFPFITPQKYNDAIKEIFTLAGITRNVEVRNALTGETEIRPINEVASSHLARRTFCGNLYSKVQDPNLIGKMSGHVEGSKAFTRYRKIEDKTLKETINLIG